MFLTHPLSSKTIATMTYTPECFMSFLKTLSSKICHDLISPIGAVNNGLEILEEMGPDAGPEVIELISFSAQQASAKLKAFRLAYGSGGSDNNLKASDAHEAIEAIVGAEQKIRQNWDAHETFGFNEERPSGLAKIITALLLLSIEGLPKGGEISAVSGESAGHIVVRANGENVNFKEEICEVLEQKASIPSSPKNIHAQMCVMLCTHYNFDLTLNQNDHNGIQISAMTKI